MGYWILEPPVKSAMRVYYKRVKAVGIENIPGPDKLTILVANHQNGMMDPFMCCAFAPRQLHWLTRADIFRSTIARKALMHLNMLPVYRERDKVDNIHDKNDAIFKICYDRLNDGNIVCLFPEGNHNHIKHLRSLKKGAARVAFGALEANGLDKEVFIVPVGIEYSNFQKFRSNLLLNFGKPLKLSQFLNTYKTNTAAAINECTSAIADRLSEQMIDIKDANLYEFTESTRYIGTTLFRNHHGLKRGLYNEFLAYKQYVSFLSKEHKENPAQIDKMAEEYKAVQNEIVSKKLEPELIERVLARKISSIVPVMAMILLFPFAVIGLLINGIPGLLIHEYVKKKIKDVHFKSSIMFFMGVFMIPIFWTFIYLMTALITGEWLWSLLAFPVSLITGIAALKVFDNFRIMRAANWIAQGKKGKDKWANRAIEMRTEMHLTFSKTLN